MKLTVIGSGDAFGSGGRLQTCFHVAAGDEEFLIDCGATATIGISGLGLDPNRIPIGYQLCVPATPAPPACPAIYVVQRGDTYTSIAARLGVPMDDALPDRIRAIRVR